MCALPSVEHSTISATAYQIAKIAGIPENQRPRLRLDIELLVKGSKDVERQNEDLVDRVGRIHHDWTARRLRVLEARAALKKAATGLQVAIADYDNEYGKKMRMDEVAPAPIDALLREVVAWAVQEAPIFLYRSSYESRGRGRPRGTLKHTVFIDYVVSLLVLVRGMGGDLTFDKNRLNKSTLVRALKLLTPHFPAGFVPSPLPVRAIVRALSIANRGIDAFIEYKEEGADILFARSYRRALSGTKIRAAKRPK
jgi:hypothetical protein